ncbi:MAG: hypothetical protein WAM60_04610 [Candidatus Promineifilaceae bacterium]
MSFEGYFARTESQLIDFWGRRQNIPVYNRTFSIFGRSVQLSSNEAVVLQAADFSQPLYSSAPPVDDKVFNIQIVVRPSRVPPGPLPNNLFDHIQYTGHDQWLAIQVGGWGHCQVNLAAGKALAILSPELGSRPESISRFLLNTILNNFMKSLGLGFLHTTAVYRSGRILMMMADHNSGKSTTALHLALAGYAFVSDSQIYIEHGVEGIRLFGFPVGRVKLRQDMLPHFPTLQPFLEPEPGQGETKFRLDLHRVDPRLVYDEVIRPEKTILCLLSRNDRGKTSLSPASVSETLETAMLNSLFYDSAEAWRKNFVQIERFVQTADRYHLSVGTDNARLLQVVGKLME